MSTLDELTALPPRDVPLGGPRGMTVRRTLPARRTSLVGAWCFVDHFGPDDVSTGGGMQVARHPHTGLATVSWLFGGAITHRDSIGSHALVVPGDVDLMVAGSGITHSEYSTGDTTVLHGVQLWYALPDAHRFRDREFVVHRTVERTAPGVLCRVGLGAVRLRAGDGTTLRDASPVTTDTALTLVQLDLEPGAAVTLELDPAHEHGVLVDRGPVDVTAVGRTQQHLTAGRGDLVLTPDGSGELTLTAADGPVRVLVLGGEPLGEEIVMWWNFVGRDHEEIAAFRARYQAEIGAEGDLAQVPVDPVTRDRGGLAADTEQFGPFPPATPAALPAPALPQARLRPRGRTGRMGG